MRKFVATIYTLIFLNTLSIAQTAVPDALRARFTIERLISGTGLSKSDLMYGIPLPPGSVVGDTYLDKKWNLSEIILYENDRVIEGYPIKYDIKGEMIEISARNGIKVIEARKIHTFAWIDSLIQTKHFFVNAKEYRLDGSPLTGFLEVVSDGQVPLFKRTVIYERAPDYVPALDMGTRDTRILKKEVFYMRKGKDLKKIGSRRSLLSELGTHADDVEQYIKVNNLDLDKENHLIRVFDYYNSKLNQPAN